MHDFRKAQPDPYPERFKEQIESAMLAGALRAGGEGPTDTRKAIYETWIQGSFTAAVCDWRRMSDGVFEWKVNPESGSQFDLIWHSPTGLSCYLARVYRQPDGSWAALVNAGVSQSDPSEAMAKAEWAISRLTA